MLRVPETVSARPLGVFRMVIGLVAVVKGLDLVSKTRSGDDLEPAYGFVPVLSPVVWTVVAGVLAVCGALLALGIWARFAALATGVLALASVWGAYYHNHIYLLATLALLLAFTESDAALSVRSRRGFGRTEVWASPVYLLRAQISIVYLYAAANKVNFDFLSGNTLAVLGFRSPLVPEWSRIVPLLAAMAIGAVAAEFFVGIALWLPPLRPIAMTIGVLLHLGMIVYLSRDLMFALNLALFAAPMIAGYALFLDWLPSFGRRTAQPSIR